MRSSAEKVQKLVFVTPHVSCHIFSVHTFPMAHESTNIENKLAFFSVLRNFADRYFVFYVQEICYFISSKKEKILT